MEPFVCSPIRHAAPDGAWFSGERLSYKHAAPNGAKPDGPPPTHLRQERHLDSAAGTPPTP